VRAGDEFKAREGRVVGDVKEERRKPVRRGQGLSGHLGRGDVLLMRTSRDSSSAFRGGTGDRDHRQAPGRGEKHRSPRSAIRETARISATEKIVCRRSPSKVIGEMLKDCSTIPALSSPNGSDGGPASRSCKSVSSSCDPHQPTDYPPAQGSRPLTIPSPLIVPVSGSPGTALGFTADRRPTGIVCDQT